MANQLEFSLPGLLRIAAMFGLNVGTLKQLALDKGVPAVHDFLRDHSQKAMNAAVPHILSNLATKAPLDGQKRTDKDGIEFEDWAYLSHESLYLLVKAVVKKGSDVIDGVRDADLAKVLAIVGRADHGTPEAVVRATLAAEIEVFF